MRLVRYLNPLLDTQVGRILASWLEMVAKCAKCKNVYSRVRVVAAARWVQMICKVLSDVLLF